MKSPIWATLIASLLIAIPATAGKKLTIDSFTDGDNKSEQGGWWYVYDDARLGGNSEMTPSGCTLTPTKGTDAQGYAAHVQGTTGNKLGWDYFGFGVTVAKDSGCPNQNKVNLSQYSTLEFKIKGEFSGGRLVVLIPYHGDTCEGNVPETMTHWADYETSINADITSEWTTVRLNLRNDFKQPFWTKPEDRVSIETVLKSVSVLQWHFSSADGDTLDVWIDDVVLY
ncbi:MAG: hypothetical protein JXX29_09495 [Deltaproteobacteria bacterium]|nr:hypothetical protein [Deltaproteobacteria bacterium]MBN2671898.1 hypothetical protein [Deltaproteobacteria bacterium]